jgi:FSR family fosmidomycin resistance protein-like MFS transporter
MPKTQSLPASIEPPEAPMPAVETSTSAIRILFALSFCHLLNDAIQALIPAIYPLLKESFKLNFTQIDSSR